MRSNQLSGYFPTDLTDFENTSKCGSMILNVSHFPLSSFLTRRKRSGRRFLRDKSHRSDRERRYNVVAVFIYHCKRGRLKEVTKSACRPPCARRKTSPRCTGCKDRHQRSYLPPSRVLSRGFHLDLSLSLSLPFMSRFSSLSFFLSLR